MKARWPQRARGAVLLELALTLQVLLMLVAMLVFYGRILYHYQVAQKAVHDGARYFASSNALNLKSTTQVAHEVEVTQAIVRTELGTLNLAPASVVISVGCDGLQCSGFNLPTTVVVGLQMQLENDYPGFLGDIATQTVTVSQSMRYANN